MCGRLDLTPTPVLNDFLDRHRLPHITPSTNVAPTETVPVIIQTKHLELHPMRWWLTPSWAPEPTTTKSHTASTFKVLFCNDIRLSLLNLFCLLREVRLE